MAGDDHTEAHSEQAAAKTQAAAAHVDWEPTALHVAAGPQPRTMMTMMTAEKCVDEQCW